MNYEDSISAAINQYNDAAEKAQLVIKEQHGILIKPIDIQELLGKRLGLKYSIDVIRHNLTK